MRTPIFLTALIALASTLVPGAAPAAEAEAEAAKATEAEAAKAARAEATALKSAAEKLAACPEEVAEADRSACARLLVCAEKAQAAAAAAKAPAWTGQVAGSVVSVTGNANAVTSKVSASVTGDFRGWATELKAQGAYGRARPVGDDEGELTALNGEVRARGDRKLGERVSLYLLGGTGADHLASIELQAFGEIGAGVVLVHLKEGERTLLKVRTDLGFRGTRERLFQYLPTPEDLPDRSIYAPRAAGELKWALSETAGFTESVEVLPDILDGRNLRVTSTSILGAEIVSGLSLQLAFTVRYIGRPAEGKVPTDTELAGGVSYTF